MGARLRSPNHQRNCQESHRGEQYVVTPASNQSKHVRSPVNIADDAAWCMAAISLQRELVAKYPEFKAEAGEERSARACDIV